MIADAAVGLAATAVIFFAAPYLNRVFERGGEARWIVPQTWLVLIVVWHVVAGGVVAAAFDNPNTVLGSSADDLRKQAVLAGTPLVVLALIAAAVRWRLVWSRRRVPLVWAIAALGAVGLLGAFVGLALGNQFHYISSDTWRWAVIPLVALLVAADENPRAWLVLAAPVVVGTAGLVIGAYDTFSGIGDGALPGPVSTLTFAAAAVTLGWAARWRSRWLIPLSLLVSLELAITLASAHRTAAVVAAVAVLGAIAVAGGARARLLTAGAIAVPAAVVAVAVATIDPVREHVQPALDKWETRVDQEVIPRSPELERGALRRLFALVDGAPAFAAEEDFAPRCEFPPDPPPSISSVGERREEVDRSLEWLWRGGPGLDVARSVVGLGQGTEYRAHLLPPLDERGKPGFRHHIHVTYVSALVRNGLVGLLALFVALALMVATAWRAVRAFPDVSATALTGKIALVATLCVTIEMFTGFVFIGTLEGGLLAASALALGLQRHGRAGTA